MRYRNIEENQYQVFSGALGENKEKYVVIKEKLDQVVVLLFTIWRGEAHNSMCVC